MKDERIVFALEDGEYSDYHVIGIYSTRERAESVRAVIGGDIVERTLDPAWKEINAGLSRWHILMSRDGTTEKIERQEISQYNMKDGFYIWRRTEVPAYKGRGIPDCLNSNVWARNEKHAIKIVNEKRTRLIADGGWK